MENEEIFMPSDRRCSEKERQRGREKEQCMTADRDCWKSEINK